MEYEYEKRIRSSVELELFRDGRHFREYDPEVIKELKSVYAKAKAFDEIVNLRNNHYYYSKTSSGTPIKVINTKPFGREVNHLINKKGYWEDK